MRRDRAIYSFAAVLGWLYVYYTGQAEWIPALLIPVVIHELGHVTAIRGFGLKISALRLELRGMCIAYRGEEEWTEHAVVAAAGPIAGLLYAEAATELAQYSGAWWLEVSGEISFFFSAFNLLPIYPLDGGHILFALAETALPPNEGERLFWAVSRALISILLGVGLYSAVVWKLTAPFAAGLWLCLQQNDQMPLAKGWEIS